MLGYRPLGTTPLGATKLAASLPPATGALAANDNADSASLAGSLVTSGALAATDSPDTASFVAAGTMPSGDLAATEAADTASFTGALTTSGSINATEAQDAAAFSGSLVSVPVSGALAATEAKDTANIVATGPFSFVMALTERADASNVIGLVSGETEVPREIAVPGVADDNPVRFNTAIRQIIERLGEYSKLDSPVFSGDPTAPTPAINDSSKSLATTAFIKAQGYATQTEVTTADASLQTQIDGKAALGHTHPESDITGLVADLAGKEPTIAVGTASQYWRGDKTWQAFPAQKLVASYVDTLKTVTAVSAVIPYDNTVPLVTEGTQIFSRSVTTTSATQVINVLFISSFSLSGTSNTLAAALFNGSTLIGVGCNFGGTSPAGFGLTAAASVAPGAAGTYTISARVGPGSAGTFNLNAEYYGGGASTVMITQVIEP